MIGMSTQSRMAGSNRRSFDGCMVFADGKRKLFHFFRGHHFRIFYSIYLFIIEFFIPFILTFALIVTLILYYPTYYIPLNYHTLILFPLSNFKPTLFQSLSFRHRQTPCRTQ
jgi:hypothetical protein